MASGKITYGNPFRYYVEGKEVTKSEFDKVFPNHPIRVPNTLMQTSQAWPRLSDAWGVGKGQKEKAEETFKKLGVPTEMVPDGAGGYSAKILNNEHQRKLLRATRMHNRDGGYGQITG